MVPRVYKQECMTTSRADIQQPPPDDITLLRKIAGGDVRALEALYDRYSAVVYSMVLRILRSPELAEEVTQEAFWRVWRRSSTFQSARGSVTGWIFGIAHNLAIDELRRQQARPTPVYDTDERPVLGELEDHRADVAGQAAFGEQATLIRKALAQIPRDQREVIELSYFGGLSQSEIAGQLQQPIGTVKTRARLALQKLRDILTKQGFQVEDL